MMSTEYHLDELDITLGDVRPQAADVSGPPHRDGSRRTAPSTRTTPSTRRGSLIPGVGALTSASQNAAKKQQQQHRLDELNLFNFDLRDLVRDMLLPKGGESRVSYHEYAVFAPASPDAETRSPSIMSEGEEGLQMFRSAVVNGHGLDIEVRNNNNNIIYHCGFPIEKMSWLFACCVARLVVEILALW